MILAARSPGDPKREPGVQNQLNLPSLPRFDIQNRLPRRGIAGLPRSLCESSSQLETSLRTLRTDHVDLWQMHNVARMQDVDRIFAPGGAMEAFQAAKKAGKCRYIGYTVTQWCT
jgi:predicted aldo/keto reductase-like oxidoreductase